MHFIAIIIRYIFFPPFWLVVYSVEKKLTSRLRVERNCTGVLLSTWYGGGFASVPYCSSSSRYDF